MNLLRKQGLYNSFTLYLGTALGFFNLIILFQRNLKLEEIGFFSLMNAIALLYVQFSTLGFTNVITRYFPFFKTEDKKHGGFPLFVFFICFAAFGLLAVGFLLSKNLIINHYTDYKGSSLLLRHYEYIIPLAFCVMTYSLQEVFLRAVYKNIIPSFFREVVLKLLTSVGILLITAEILNYEQFLLFYLGSNAFLICLILYYSFKVKVYRLAGISGVVKNESGKMINYGLYSMLGGSSVVLVQNLDVIMLGMLTNEVLVGIYTTFFAIALIINLPSKALSATSYQLVADAWKEENLSKIGNVYSKTSVVQLLLGSLFFIGLIANKYNLLYLLHKEEYTLHFDIFIVIGLGFLADVTGGLNGMIISFSSKYKIVMVGLIIAAIICAILNLLLIPYMGMMGAALSYLGTMFTLNLIYSGYIAMKWRLQPFGRQHLQIIVIALLSLVLGLLIPQMQNYYVDVFVRSTLITAVFTVFSYYLKVSPEINEVINMILLKLGFSKFKN